jgi:hypothetical protein
MILPTISKELYLLEKIKYFLVKRCSNIYSISVKHTLNTGDEFPLLLTLYSYKIGLLYRVSTIKHLHGNIWECYNIHFDTLNKEN